MSVITPPDPDLDPDEDEDPDLSFIDRIRSPDEPSEQGDNVESEERARDPERHARESVEHTRHGRNRSAGAEPHPAA